MKKKFFLLTLIFCAFDLFCAERIVVLSPAAQEILYAIGAENKIVARTDFCNYPAEAENIPSVGGFDGKTLSIEKIISFKPDLVYGSRGMHDFLKESCDRFGVELFLSMADSIQGVYDEISFIGSKTGCETESEKIILKMKEGFDKIQNQLLNNPEKKRKTVYWEIWNSPYMTAGGSSFINELIYVSGGENIFSDITEQTYPVISEESILARNPDVIILPFGNIEECCKRNGWNFISAVRSKRVYTVNDDIFSRPGPRILDAAEMLCEILKQ